MQVSTIRFVDHEVRVSPKTYREVTGQDPADTTKDVLVATIQVPHEDTKLEDLVAKWGDRIRTNAIRQIVQDLANEARVDWKEGGKKSAKRAAKEAIQKEALELQAKLQAGDLSVMPRLVELMKLAIG